MRLFRRPAGVAIALGVVIWSLTTHGKFSDSGDEPHYLIIAESLVSDRDLDLSNNYGHGSGRWFGAADLEGGPHARQNARGTLWSGHDIGLPVLLLPVYTAATRLAAHAPEDLLARVRQTRGLFAYSLISLALIVFTCSAASWLLAGLRRHAGGRHATLTVVALMLTPPVMGHAFLVFPETPAFAVVCAAVWLVCLRDDEVTPGRMFGVVLAIGVTPWLHRKYAFLSVGLLMWIAHRHLGWLRTRRPVALASIAAAGLVPHAALHAWTLVMWGHLGGGFMTEGSLLSTATFWTGALGLLFDRERGLVSYAPIFLIAPACWAITWRETWRAAAVAALLYLPMAAFVVWGAGFSPPARYLVPVLPLVAYGCVRALERPAIRRAALPLAVLQLAISAYVWQRPRAMWPLELGTNQALAHIPLVGPLYERALPSLLTGDPASWGWTVAGATAVLTVALVALATRSQRT